MNKKEPKPLSQILKESAIRALWLVVIVFIVYLLQGCGNKRLAAVEERYTHNSKVQVNDNDDYSAVNENTKVYQVQPGDTLYSIAFRFGLDYQTLAKSNGISSAYLINIGQNLDIASARNYQEPTVRQVVTVVKPKTSSQAVRRTVQSTNKQPKHKPVTVSQNTKPNPKLPKTPKVSSKPKTQTEAKPSNSQSAKLVDSNNPVKFWIWPYMGKVERSFVGTGKKGIDIVGNVGDPVRASAAGRVVYAGRGLRGYGNLVIIKHNNSFISAYAHNKSIDVKENEIIKAGQKIAELGSSDTDSPRLHFEIRYKGKPTDPLKYLPKR
ncbi:peptidoglycan DD-metalloendopeptidase family protein [Kangiella sp. HZ709]|uniref:peptidoglycan DD-metalloendopeptidase family protein n=1 Tax=Kangiella sp. HZ709 TaxID=2666328 RepID=UPI0012AF6400|nr:peptidoglycan DD-metalloendopeptidase family protein [Kangiella sp. HZ709]MRX28373.1 peptidoglycan DD-metalloendopeptidase family protein [Kangiella sp. HZ709]